ncbi:MAG: type IV pilus assembly protein PilB [Parcubacteria group bacterium Gr01-1014_18]|nr:MAG: type IV pilus assembly protein PilB [Parcubacteria group bacterium Greene0416_36]TSC79773.1 MAG: type IV pilus assembly protein PilB [Parcubacteria group bacterium Gr01-1014_18]TSC97975.1 MAG: type IV pilus assembly protein PilB [Parcubacteria group bacterium Greene1014_20]TSD06604.1 MAG: type IV pilus assembly protein PilB [Parcubacteria group bacterium Greene0714_2]
MVTSEEVKKLILDYQIIGDKQAEELFSSAKEEGISFEKYLVYKNILKAEELGQLIADYKKVPFVFLKKVNLSPDVIRLVPESMASDRGLIVFEKSASGIKVAMMDPDDTETIRLLKRRFLGGVLIYLASESDIMDALVLYKKNLKDEFAALIAESVAQAEEAAKTAQEEEETAIPIVNMVDTVLKYAYNSRASDIHLEPQESEVFVRFRVDGMLQDVLSVPKFLHPLVVSRIKVMSRLRTDEHMSAQDGKFRIREKGYRFDVRVSVIPITEGEKIVMRLLTEKSKTLTLQDLGFSDACYEIVKRNMKRPHGMILATGPTGSGKTTTLYAILQILNKRSINISTIEDPVEYHLGGVNQIQVNSRTNLTFASGLRSILRQDPDVIMVGEIRDQETAGISINAALTGHLVLSTLHTNDAATTLPRLIDMHVESFLVASSVNIAIAQRLIRKICPKCIISTTDPKALEEVAKSVDLKKKFGITHFKDVVLYRGKGCLVCRGSGYAGRLGIFEVLEMTDTIRDMVMSNRNASEIRHQAIREGMIPLIEDGIEKVLRGDTTIAEVLRVAID